SIRKLEQNDSDASLRDFLGSLKKFQAAEDAKADTPAGESKAGKGGLSMPFDTRDNALSSGPKYNGYAHSFAGMGVQFILFMGVDMGIGILLARRMGIWNRLLAAPLTMTEVLMSRALSAAIIALGLVLAIFACGVIIFHVQISNPVGFVMVALSFALMTASFGLLIAAFGKTPEAARGMAVFATLILVMLGGAWVPSFIFPEWMQKLTVVVPTRWAVDGLDAMTWRGLGMDAAFASSGVQLGFAAAFILLAIWRFRSQQA
ncbi:ABC transporter permease, partial [Pseudoduganella sp. RAF53_2]